MTTYTGPTPYDYRDDLPLETLNGLRGVYLRGRQDAKAADAKLLEALNMFLATAPRVLRLLHDDWDGTHYNSAGNEAIREVEAAVRQAEN